MKDFLKKLNNSEFSYVSKKDKRQVITLIICIFIVIGLSKIYHNCFSATAPQLSEEEKAMMKVKIDELNSNYQLLKQNDTLNKLDSYIKKRYDTLQLFEFDPNTVTEKELLALGLTDKQITNMMKYRKNGGVFKDKEDFRKLYGLRTMQYNYLKSYLRFGNIASAENSESKVKNPKDSIFKERSKVYKDFDPNFVDEAQLYEMGFSTKQIESFLKLRENGRKFYVKKDFATVFFVDADKYKELEKYIKIDLNKLFNGEKLYDVNLATAEQLKSIGFTNSEAEDVIEYREKVGYFYAPWQISECIKYDRANKLKSKIYTCASVELKKIKINKLTAEELSQHPYFSKKQADAIIKFRTEKGNIKHLADLQTMNAFDDKEIKKIGKYLEL